MNVLMDKCESFIAKKSGAGSEAAKKALEVLLAVVLDPRFKVEYFESDDSDSGKRMAKTAKKTFNDEYKTYNKRKTNLNPPEQDDVDDDNIWQWKKKPKLNETEIDRYLKQPTADRNVDTLAWWKLHENEFPFLASMARDYLAIPATSASTE